MTRRAIHAAVVPARQAKRARNLDELDRMATDELRRRGRTGILRPFRRRAKPDGSVVVVVAEILTRSPACH